MIKLRTKLYHEKETVRFSWHYRKDLHQSCLLP